MSLIPGIPRDFDARIKTALRESMNLSAAHMFNAMVPLRVTLQDAQLSGSDTFRVSGGYTFAIWGYAPHIALNAIASEDSPAGPDYAFKGILGARDRALLKALNARIQMNLPDDDNMPLIVPDMIASTTGGTNTSLSLGTLMGGAGGRAARFTHNGDSMPQIVPESHQVGLTVTLRDTPTDAVADFSTEYGINLIGTFFRTRLG